MDWSYIRGTSGPKVCVVRGIDTISPRHAVVSVRSGVQRVSAGRRKGMTGAIDAMKLIISVTGDIFLVAHVHFLLAKSLGRSIPAFLVIILEAIALVMIIRQSICLHSSGGTVNGWIGILVEDRSLLVQARRKANDQEFSIGKCRSFIEGPG